MRFILICIFFLVNLVGCASLDYNVTNFEPVSSTSTSNTFKYTAFADAIYPENSVSAEKTRIEWLERWLSANGMANKKYKITDRSAVKRSDGWLGSTYLIYYQVHVDK